MTKQTRLDARGAREKLKLRGNPYWGPKAGHELDLGYRRIKSGIGSWVMRRYVAETKTYTATTFAAADDRDEADGVNILSYRQAQIRARELAKAADEEERVAALGPPLDVSRAVADYVEERERRHDAHSLAGSKHNCRRRLAGLLAANPRLAKTPMAALTGSMLGELECDLRTRHDLKAS